MRAGKSESEGLAFYDRLAVHRDFRALVSAEAYRPLPAGWFVGTADLVGSTEEIAAGRYKIVNTAAASVVAALANALEGRDFPFVFGGDGASFALPGALEPLARRVLAALVRFVAGSFDMRLRAAIVPLEAIRAAGLDVRVARYAPSPDVAYAMFTGGGLAFAEARMKAGEFAVDPAGGDERPDLTGLTCRFAEIPATRGVVLSLIALPAAGGAPGAFERLEDEILLLGEENPASGNPLPPGGPPFRWPGEALGVEATLHASAGDRSAGVAWAWVTLRTLFSHLLFRFGLSVGGFDPARYRRELVENTDFRKFDDGLRMTIDCTPALADRIEARLAAAEAAGVARVGTFRQAASLMTCFVPSASRSDHVHFLDGADGGYARAAALLKARERDTKGAPDRSDAPLRT